MSLPRCLVPAKVLLLVIVLQIHGAIAEVSPNEAWEDAAKLLVNEAHERFTKFEKAGTGNQREVRFGQAVTLLNIQPKTAGNIARAAGLFEQLVSEKVADDFTVLSRYFLARIEQVHLFEPNAGKAAELYRALIRDYPAHAVAQDAAVKLGMMLLFEHVAPDERERRFAEVEAMAAVVTDPAARRDLHMVLADACSLLRDDQAGTLVHLLAADAIGIQRTRARSDIWVRIGELARLQGQPDVAAQYYRKFLDNYRRDARRYTIEQRLAELSGGLQ